MEFIIMTLSFTVAILLAGVVSVFIMMQPKVVKWYMKKVQKLTMGVIEDSLDMIEEETV
jgi:hypothetical protein